MASRILIQPGQIWQPSSSAVPSRRIVDLVKGIVSYTCDLAAPPGEASQMVSQQLFRRWIRENDVSLVGNTGEKVSPSAELAKKIVSLRKAHGMTQEDLAEKLGLSRSAVAALETGRSSSTRKHVPTLAEIFGVPVDFFLTGMVEAETSMTVTADEADLLGLYRTLSPELKLKLQRLAETLTRQA
ncbi:helix-turn-helix domain-containing protein [Acidomonas methanolica]|uniref:HTH cro/C1-type domain-containing protein n=1 Tax=Acidomonas methanolica NBRC 104435 TaxID=1231351 RepID=A0A023D4A7_ACIMT|nr:helix-turn-helix domain-containing protein [Acidomonas methanolica]TCS28492.1 transcriptional regulator with XRE-family HTH domain [Acidomonas methanolica]GAJ28636.1 hypothetical protein Amme_032_014 [Acidomonas methanolica NBRC 104435]GBQ51631.1 transcriptional regulator [Acidomonas methanolica]GEK99534.1 hypothetical protein AME01nite_20330 [Acidomonas methanolica NBRC 104435]